MNIGTLAEDRKTFHKSIDIDAPPSKVWHMLTNQELMKKWMMPDMELTIITDWKVGSPVTIRGNMNGKDFENRGMVLQFEPETILRYSHLSSISRLPERPESYSIIEFRLQPVEDKTSLAFTLSNFPTESIYKHLAFYWNVALEILKQMTEEQG